MTLQEVEIESENEIIKNELCVFEGIVLRGSRIVMPRSLQVRALELVHEGHIGIVGMKQRLRTKVWWRFIDKDVESWCKSCHGCQLVQLPDRPEPMMQTEIPAKPWEFIGMDFQGPLPSGHNLLVTIDYYSRFYEVDIMTTISAEKLTEKSKVMFARYGPPDTLITDNGKSFIDAGFNKFLNNVGVSHRCSTPFWPQANGEMERQNRSIVKRLRIAQTEEKLWREELLTYLFAYRTTPHSVTGVPPAELMFHRKIKTKLPELPSSDNLTHDEEIRDRDRLRKEKGREYSDYTRSAKPSNIKVGDSVLLRQKKQDKLSTPFKPIPMSVISKSPEGVVYKRNSTQLKRYYERESSIQIPANQHGGVPDQENEATDSNEETVQTQVTMGPEKLLRPRRTPREPDRFGEWV